MKHIRLITLFLCIGFYPMNGQEDIFSAFDIFFKKYVESGQVDYLKVKQDLKVLSSLKDAIGEFRLEEKDRNSRIAFLLNTYNFLAIYSIAESYPVDSPLDIPGFFNGKRFRVAGKGLTLERLEKQYLTGRFKDPRFHFALVCAAKGCPPFPFGAFEPDKLDRQLNTQMAAAINDPDFVQIDPKKAIVYLSQIFVWYASELRTIQRNYTDLINSYLKDPVPENYQIRYYSYDWSLNDLGKEPQIDGKGIPIQSYTPSVLLRPRQVEFKVFWNLYTQRHFFDEGRTLTWANERATFFTSIFQFQTGISKRLNVGIDLYFRSATFKDPETSALEVFSFLNTTEHRTALSGLGPKFRYTPFRIPGLSLQTTLLFPVANDLQGFSDEEVPENNRPFLDHDGYQLFQSFLYDRPLSARLQLYAEAGFWLKLDRNFRGENTSLITPMKVFLTFLANHRTSFYGMTDFGPDWGGPFYVQSGLGVKTQLAPHFELEFLYTNFWAGRISGGGYTINLGGRVVY